MTEDKNLSLKRRFRTHQSDQSALKQFERVHHCTRALPDSAERTTGYDLR